MKYPNKVLQKKWIQEEHNQTFNCCRLLLIYVEKLVCTRHFGYLGYLGTQTSFMKLSYMKIIYLYSFYVMVIGHYWLLTHTMTQSITLTHFE